MVVEGPSLGTSGLIPQEDLDITFSPSQRKLKLAKELQVHFKQIPALATQLNIIATVKTATPEDYKSDVVIVTNAEKLMESVVKTLNASETLCVKGLNIIEHPMPDEASAASLATQWKRKLLRHRRIEASSPDVDSLGLRRISKNTSMPSLTEMFQRGLRS
ncbi:hypothetical protein HOLleu_32893 [Holothuria leucospilota]|uniref:Uncharacterized protein n=1 Tax=Holothuria leucospilota TaxID=206669 RepID=A0A9Q1BF13_HOLLE|nr:hypothetical protein HOLleu_32893 [Holothuria leucospilota]